MREFLLNNKWKVIRLALLLIVFAIIVMFVHGRSIYNEKMQKIEQAKKTLSN